MTEDERGFVAEAPVTDDYLIFDYVFETTDDPWKAAVHLCREQSTALWRRPDVDEDYRPKHAAKVSHLEELGEVEREGVAYRRVRVHVAHPWINFGTRIPNMLTAACGEGTYFTPSVAAIRLEDITFPEPWLAHFQGPHFGLDGLRQRLELTRRPIITGVIKPNIGMPIDPFADLAYEALVGGADIVKDDEMLADTEYSPLKLRASRVYMRVRDAIRESSERKIFIANITDEVDMLMEHHDAVHMAGGETAAIMLNAMTVGLSACRLVANYSKVPVFSHFDFMAAFTRIPWHGVSELVMTKLQRLVGFDAIIMPGLGGRMQRSTEDVLRNVRACLEPMGELKPVLPMPGGSDWAGSLPGLVQTLGTHDFSIICGRGIFGHPRGAAAGAKSIRQAWRALEMGIPLERYATEAAELSEAITAFGESS